MVWPLMSSPRRFAVGDSTGRCGLRRRRAFRGRAGGLRGRCRRLGRAAGNGLRGGGAVAAAGCEAGGAGGDPAGARTRATTPAASDERNFLFTPLGLLVLAMTVQPL